MLRPAIADSKGKAENTFRRASREFSRGFSPRRCAASTPDSTTSTRAAGLVCLVLLLAACGTTVQTTSEDDYLGRYAVQAVVAKGQAIDPTARQAILREPALRFPARIGLARIEKGA